MLCELVVILSILWVGCGRVTIVIDSEEGGERDRRQLAVSGYNLPIVCQNATSIDNQTITFPPGFESVSVPWMRTDLNPLLFTSPALSASWERLVSMKVKGINATLREVIDHLEENNCLFLPWGGSIRDMILGEPPHDVEAVVSCSQDRAWYLCSTRFGPDNCEKYLLLGSTKLRIGSNRGSPGGTDNNTIEPIDVVQWTDTFEIPPTQWEFTPNSLTYYVMPNNGPQALIDLTEMGFADVCEKKIRIPVPEPLWPEWAGEVRKQLIKRLRFWKLRAKGFEARDPQTQYFVTDSLRREINRTEMQKFYCTYVFEGEYYDDGQERSCILPLVNSTDLKESKRAIDLSFEKDFGTLYWERTLKPAFDSLPVIQNGAQINPSSERTTLRPVGESTDAPVEEDTDLPVLVDTDLPVIEDTDLPVVEDTTAQIVEDTAAPVSLTTQVSFTSASSAQVSLTSVSSTQVSFTPVSSTLIQFTPFSSGPISHTPVLSTPVPITPGAITSHSLFYKVVSSIVSWFESRLGQPYHH